MKSIIVKIHPHSYEEWIRISYLNIRKKHPTVWIGFIGAILIILASVLVFTASLLTGEVSNQIYLFLFISILLFLFVFLIDRNIRSEAKKAVKLYNTTEEYLVNEKGFSKTDPNESNFYYWKDFDEAIISKYFILLMNENSNYFITFFSRNYKAEEFDQILIWVKENVKVI